MNGVIELDKVSRVREQASIWLVRMQEGLLPEQKPKLQQWVDADEIHGETLLEMASVWDDMGVLTELAPMFDGVPMKHAATKQESKSGWGLQQSPWAYAAMLLVALLVTVTLLPNSILPNSIFNLNSNNYLVGSSHGQQRYQTEIGEHSTIQLSDGSLVTLNTDSEIAVSFNSATRNIKLIKGEAHFEVAKDTSRPLSVAVGDSTVRAVGTAFNVMKTGKNDLEVVVNEGKVAVYSPMAKARSWIAQRAISKTALIAGDVLTISDNNRHIIQYDSIEMENRLAWQDGMVLFEDDTLREVIEELSRYSKTRILLGNEMIGETRVAGYFRVGDIDALLIALKENFNIVSTRKNDYTIILSSL